MKFRFIYLFFSPFQEISNTQKIIFLNIVQQFLITVSCSSNLNKIYFFSLKSRNIEKFNLNNNHLWINSAFTILKSVLFSAKKFLGVFFSKNILLVQSFWRHSFVVTLAFYYSLVNIDFIKITFLWSPKSFRFRYLF